MVLQQFIRVARSNSCTFRHFSQQANGEFKEIPREVRRQMRKRAPRKTAQNPKTNMQSITRIGGLVGFAGLGIWFGLLDEETKKTCRTGLKNSPLGSVYDYLAVQVAEIAKPFTDPSREKLLPDWPLPGFPPNVPCPPTLILDLEDTLVHSEWDRKYGWRHAKRPGVDKFLESVARYYEVVVFSKHQFGMTEEVITALDKKGCVLHRLFRDSTRFIDGHHVKDLSGLNRNLDRAILIDDDPRAYALQKRNTIPIKPYLNGEDRSDTELLDLIPFLQAVAAEGVQDIPELLDEFRNENGDIEGLPAKYAARLQALKDRKREKQSKGLGGFLRGRISAAPAGPPKRPGI